MRQNKSDANIDASAIPKFWGLLSNADRYQYMYLRAALSNPTTKNVKNKRVENFTETLEIIRQYTCRGDGDDWRRFLVTGIAWLSNGAIAVNTHQLRLLIMKCKSSINGSLHKMGFNFGMERSDATAILIQAIPILKDNAAELRQWTVRNNKPLTPQSSPPTPTQIESPVQPQVPIQIVGVPEPAPQAQAVISSYEQEATEFGDSCSFENSFTEQLDFGFDSTFDSCLW